MNANRPTLVLDDEAKDAVLTALGQVQHMTPDRHAGIIMAAAVGAGVFQEGERPDAFFDPRRQILKLGPYEIPKGVLMAGVPSTIQHLIMSKAYAEIGKQIADKAIVVKQPLSDEARTAISNGHAADLVILDEKIPEVYGASETTEYGKLRMSGWIQTYTGKKFHVLEPRVEDFNIKDIAHALSLTNRYTGHTRVAYSVAEHSVRVMWCVKHLIADEFEKASGRMSITWDSSGLDRLHTIMLAALLHDASEAYLNDIARPIKMIPAMQFYRELEQGVEKVVAEKWGLPFPWPKVVKRADEILLVTEKRDLMGPSPAEWIVREEPLEAVIYPWSASQAEHIFLEEYGNLMRLLRLPL